MVAAGARSSTRIRLAPRSPVVLLRVDIRGSAVLAAVERPSIGSGEVPVVRAAHVSRFAMDAALLMFQTPSFVTSQLTALRALRDAMLLVHSAPVDVLRKRWRHAKSNQGRCTQNKFSQLHVGTLRFDAHFKCRPPTAVVEALHPSQTRPCAKSCTRQSRAVATDLCWKRSCGRCDRLTRIATW
jgi:hypothetical protein